MFTHRCSLFVTVSFIKALRQVGLTLSEYGPRTTVLGSYRNKTVKR